MHGFHNLGLQVELTTQLILGSFYSRIHLDGKYLCVALVIDREFHPVLSRKGRRAEGIARRIAIDRCNWIFMLNRIRCRIVQIPDKPMPARFRGRELLGTYPVRWDV